MATSQRLILFSIIILGVVSRLAPHPPNFTPLGAIALFSGFYFKNKNYSLLPPAIMAISDLLIGGFYGPVMFYVYGSFLLIFVVGLITSKRNFSPSNLLISSLLASSLFFIVTNFAVWLHGTMYAKNITGLVESYTMAIPFFRMTILGDLFYNAILFGAYALFKLPNKTEALHNISNDR